MGVTRMATALVNWLSDANDSFWFINDSLVSGVIRAVRTIHKGCTKSGRIRQEQSTFW